MVPKNYQTNDPLPGSYNFLNHKMTKKYFFHKNYGVRIVYNGRNISPISPASVGAAPASVGEAQKQLDGLPIVVRLSR